MLYSLFHLALMLIKIAHLAMRPRHVIIVLNSLRIVEKCLVYLAEVLADVPLHFESLDFSVVHCD